MPVNVPVEAVGEDVQSLLEGLNPGETVMLGGRLGHPCPAGQQSLEERISEAELPADMR